VVPGRIPRSKEALLFGDNIDLVKPGDEVELVGIYIARYECALNVKQGFPVFNTLIEANSIRPYQELRNVDEIDQK
jgi:DNA replication licensing factor MCM2